MTGYNFPDFRSPFSFSDNILKTFSNFFSPSYTINFAGKWPVEERIVSNVASYGKQLGWLSEIVLELTKGKEFPGDTLAKLKRAVGHIEQIKAEHTRSAEEDARDALERLKQEDPDQFRRIISKLSHELSDKNDTNTLVESGSNDNRCS
jgi:uncharacterized protein YdcH (DUF465 family)